MRVRLLLVVVMGCALLISGASAAFASLPPSPTGTVEAATVIGPDGASRWWYRDLRDAPGVQKREGGYAAYDAVTTRGADPAFAIYGPGPLGRGPHGGYDSTTNMCKVCHAVHRAEGAYFLLRANTQDDACNYCHIGGSARSRKIVYDVAGGIGGIYNPVGHTIGASSIIPGSSVRQWLEPVTIQTVDASMATTQTTVQVRRYYEARNEMFRFAQGHGNFAHGGRGGITRVGPNALSCMSCHQPHNALQLVWRPADAPTGYKLLRSSPSGSVTDQALQTQRRGATGLAVGAMIQVPTSTLTPANTGWPATVWTDWRPTQRWHNGTLIDALPADQPGHVTSRALSVWCADCHNLNIGTSDAVAPVFGGEMHSDRTHPVPFVGAADYSPGQCYSCHLSDMPLAHDNVCNQCHLGPIGYADMRADQEALGNWAAFDFPHSGAANDYKLLGRWTASMDAVTSLVTTSQVATLTANNLDAVCLRCHTGVGINH